jgi:hypothetical protein
VPHTDTCGLGREHLERDDGIAECLRSVEHVCAGKLRVVASPPAGELILPCGEHRQLIHQIVGMTCECVRQHERGPVREPVPVDATKRRHNLASGLRIDPY